MRLVVGDYGAYHRKQMIESLVGKAWDEIKAEAEARLKAPDVIEAFKGYTIDEAPRRSTRNGPISHRRWPVPK